MLRALQGEDEERLAASPAVCSSPKGERCYLLSCMSAAAATAPEDPLTLHAITQCHFHIFASARVDLLQSPPLQLPQKTGTYLSPG